MKLGHKDPTVIYFGRDHNGPDRPQSDRATPFWKFQKILKNHRIWISKLWSIIFFASVFPVYCKKFDSIRTKLTEEIDFEVCPYGDSGYGTAAAARRSAGYSDWTGGATACSDRSSRAFRTGGVRNWGRNRAVKTNRLVCLFVSLQPGKLATDNRADWDLPFLHRVRL